MTGVDRASILVVDDTPANVRLLRALLAADHDVTGCEGGEAALREAAQKPPDLVLLDVHMPGMNGYEVCRRLREDPATAMVPIVMITASSDEEKVRVIDAGADDFILRPFDQPVLLARIRSLLRVKRYQDTIESQAAALQACSQELERRVAEQVAELDQLRTLRRFLSPPLARALADGDAGALLTPHRQEVAVVVFDLEGYAAFSSGSAPEEVLRILTEHHEAVGSLVNAHGASVGWLNDAAVMVFFNDPIACDEPVRAAVALALEVRQALSHLAEDWARRGHELRPSIGVSHGHATLGTIGFEGRYDYTAVGPVVSEALALSRAAGGDEILLSQRARRDVERVVQAEPAAPVVGAGSPDPLAAWKVVGWTVEPPPRPPVTEVQILGPVRITTGDTTVELRASRERQLLALLALQHDTVVTVERLVDEIWDGAPTDSAVAALRVHVSRLRKTLAASGLDHLLETRPTGYLLRLGEDGTLDADRFEAVASCGRALLAEDPASAAAMLRAALDMWKGPVLVDVASMLSVIAARRRLDELRLVTLEDCLQAELDLGRHREVLAEVEALVHEHPLRERFCDLRMRALYRSGRQPEALRAFQEHRTIVVDEIGLEPSTGLTALEREIVAQAPGI